MQPSGDPSAVPRTPEAADETLTAASAGAPRPRHKHPDSIGPYRILESIGEGGMGVVYRAEQRAPVRRIVALKVIKLGMDTGEVVARFEAERQALAMMSHPNVAKVFDAGASENGRPYFAMEYVPGVALTDYCDRNRLTSRERLELFIPVCQAVQHAHQRGIIHRDLKPSNILVTLADGKPVPKVIDFGVAKATNQALTQQTLFTRTGSLVGTPEYMSPEQAMTSGLDVDTRTDIYSLGVILYELLTGTLPFDPRALRSAGLEGMARIIRETDPAKPSTRVGAPANPTGTDATSPDPKSIAQRHGTDIRTLQRQIRGDLDWIVLKAMEKDRTRRYETANGLLMDIRRHLDSEPIMARPPSVSYRVGKFARKYRAAVAAGIALLLSLVLGITGTTIEMVRARKLEAVAVAQRGVADRQRAAERAAHLEAETQRRKAESALAAMYPSNGFHAASLGDAAEASLWFATAASLADPGSELARTNAIRADQWARQAIRPVAAFSVRSAVRSMRFDPAARYLLVEARDAADPSAADVVSLWDLEHERQVGLPSDARDPVTAAAWSPGGRRVALGCRSGRVCLCSLPEGVPTELGRLAAPVAAIAFSDDGRRLAAAGGTVARTWDCQTSQPLEDEWHAPAAVTSVAWLATDPPRAVAGCADGTLRTVPIEGQPSLQLAPSPHPDVAANGAKGLADALGPLADGMLFAAGVKDVSCYNAQSGSFRYTAPSHQPIRAVARLPGRVAVAVGNHVYLLDKAEGRELRSLDAPAVVSCLAASPDGRALAAGAGGSLLLWSQNGGRLDAPPGHAGAVAALAFSGEGRLLASADANGLVRVWAGPDPIPSARIPAPQFAFAHFSADERHVIPSGIVALGQAGARASTRVYSVDTGQPEGPILRPPGSVSAALFTFAADDVVTLTADTPNTPTLQVWDWRSGRARAERKLPGSPISMSLSRDGRDLALLCPTREVMVLDQHTLAIRHQWATSMPRITVQSMVTGADFADLASGYSADGRLLFTVGSDTIEIRDADSGASRCRPIPLDGGWVRGAFLPDGRHLAVLSMDNHVRVYDTQSGQQSSSSLSVPQTPLWLDCSADSRLLLVGSADDTLRLWDWEADRLACPPLSGALFGRILAGDQAITISPTGGLRLWETHGGSQLGPSLLAGDSWRFLPQISASGGVVAEPLSGWVKVSRTSVFAPNPFEVTPADAVARAELLCGRTLGKDASLVMLSSDEWLARWRRRPAPASALDGLEAVRRAMPAWDRQETDVAEREDNDAAAEFHLQRIAAAGVISPDERVDLARIRTQRSEWATAADALGDAVRQDPGNDAIARQHVQALLLAGRTHDASEQAAQMMARATPPQSSFLTDWWTAGPFPEDLPESYMTADRLDLRQPLPPLPGLPSGVNSRWHPQADPSGMLDVAGVLAGAPHTCTYAQRQVYCETKHDFVLSVSTMAAARVWLNGTLVYEHAEGGTIPAMPGVMLHAGWNTLLVRLSGSQSSWLAIELLDNPAAIAQMHENKGELNEAVEGFLAASAKAPKDPAPLVAAARLLGRLGRFTESAARYRAAIDLDAKDHFAWYRGECTLAYLDDSDAYERTRRRMLQKYASAAAPEIAERTAKACLLLPGPADEIARAGALADRALQAPPTHAYVPYFQLAKGMAEYRAGRTEAAIEHLNKAAGTLNAALPKATAELWLAQAFHDAGKDEQARQAYARATARLAPALAAADSRDPSVGGEDWLICQVSLRQAQRALRIPSAATQPAASR